jgi:hypothetical protein
VIGSERFPITSANNAHRKAAAHNPRCSPGGEKPSGSNFIRNIIVRDLEGKPHISLSASDTFAPIPIKSWKATIQPHRCPEGYVGKDREGTTGKLIFRTALYCRTYKHLAGILAFTQYDGVALAQ